MPRKDTATLRLKKAIARAKNPERDYMAGLRPTTERPSKPNLNDPSVRAAYAHVATNFYPWGDEPLQAAFKAFELDPVDPFNWTKLLRILAEIHFKPAARRGPKIKWDDHAQRLLQLQAAIIKIENPTAKNNEVIELIKDRWGYRQPIKTLQRYLYGVPRRKRPNAKH